MTSAELIQIIKNEIENREAIADDVLYCGIHNALGYKLCLKDIKILLDILSVDEPVNLEKEIDKWFKIVRDDDDYAHIVSLNGSKCDDWKKENYVLNKPSFIDIASHFYELGLNAGK